MGEDTDPDDEDAELQRLLEAFDGADVEQQEALGAVLFARAAEWAQTREPTLRDGIQEEFYAARERRDWIAAEETCRRLLALDDAPMQRYRDWDFLADILQEQGRNNEAYVAVCEATKSARASNMDPLITIALQTEASWAVRQGERQHAYACLEEGLTRLSKSDIQQDWQHARFLVQRARLRLEDGEIAQAMHDLEITEPILMPYASSMMLTGPLSTLESWWHTTALLRVSQQDTFGANAASREALWIARRIAEFPQLAEFDRRCGLRRSLERYAKLQEKLGETDVATAARQEARTIK